MCGPEGSSAQAPTLLQVLAQDVANQLIPFSQRRNLHAKLAEAFEASHAVPPVPPAIIAYHWSESCRGSEDAEWKRVAKAVDWWERAAMAAMQGGIDDAQVGGQLCPAAVLQCVSDKRGPWQSQWQAEGESRLGPRNGRHA